MRPQPPLERAEPRPTVAADVEESPQDLIATADGDDALASHLDGLEVARGREV